MLRRLFLFVLYSFYGLVLLGVFLVVFFPKGRFLLWVADRVETALPGYECRIDDVRYVYPFDIRFHQVVLQNREEQFNIPLDSLQVGFKKKWPVDKFDFSAAFWGGTVESDVSLDQQARKVTFSRLSASSLHLDEIDFLQKRIDRQIRGELNVSGTLTVYVGRQSETEFSGTVEIENFYTKLRRPVLENSEIEFQRIETRVDLRQVQVNLSEGQFSGSLLSGLFAGNVVLQKPWQQSRIDIVGGVIPQDRLLQSDPQVAEAAAQLYRKYRKKEIPCVVNGSLEEPQFRFGLQ